MPGMLWLMKGSFCVALAPTLFSKSTSSFVRDKTVTSVDQNLEIYWTTAVTRVTVQYTSGGRLSTLEIAVGCRRVDPV